MTYDCQNFSVSWKDVQDCHGVNVVVRVCCIKLSVFVFITFITQHCDSRDDSVLYIMPE